MLRRTSRGPVAALLALLVISLHAGRAEARRNGIQVAGCWGCHRQDGQSTITLTPDKTTIAPGDVVNFAATISWSNVKVGGIYVVAPDAGTLGADANAGLTLSDGALTHSAPKAATGTSVTFNFTWTAPDTPGAVLLQTYFVAANGNNQNTGDAPGDGSYDFVWGCEPKTFYWDVDGDGHGTTMYDSVLGCADQPPPPHYAPVADDCDEDHAAVHPGAPERCNGQDDNCDGQIDENTAPENLYSDPDGDGFYGPQPGDPVVGCLPLEGYADQPGDCAPIEPDKHPGAVEVCNLIDDDCDGSIDEGVRPRCGAGRCERESPTCDPADCRPGTPLTETCNGLDDDCNGYVDDGDPCGPDAQCLGIHCVPIDGTTETSGASAGAGGTGGLVSTGGSPTGAAGRNAGSGTGGNVDDGLGGATSAPAATAPMRRSAGCDIERGGERRAGTSASLLWLLAVTFARRRRSSGA